jgi:hypothetical protein
MDAEVWLTNFPIYKDPIKGTVIVLSLLDNYIETLLHCRLFSILHQ